ncbi:MAG: hypothetical protein KGL39_05800 [Patescibacteria group bacterium]|nr:hypothetical protein [Patescibacteria group bacterium]
MATTRPPKPVALKDPTIEYLRALRTELEKVFAEQDSQIDRLRQVRTLKKPVNIPDRYRLVDVEVRDPAITDETARVVATLSVNPPKLTITPGRPSDKAQANATLRQHWTEQVLTVAGRRQPGQDTFSAVVDACAGDGAAWTKLVFARDVWDNRYSIRRKDFEDTPEASSDVQYDTATEDAKKAAGPPFSWVSVDVRTIYPVWQAGKLGEVLEVSQRPRSATFRQYRLGTDKAGNIVPEELAEGTHEAEKQVTDTVTFMEHWTPTTVTYAIDGLNIKGERTGAVVQQWKHGYGQPPYFFAPGLMTNFWRNRKVGWSVGESKRWLVEYLGFLRTIHAQVAARDALPPMFREVPSDAAPLMGEDGTPKERETWQPADIIIGRPGEKIAPLAMPPVSQALTTEIAAIEQKIQALDTPKFAGQISGMEGAGFSISQVLAEGRIRHDPIAQSIERMLVEITRFLWRLMRRKVKETVWVYHDGEGDQGGWLGAGPDDLADDVGIKWELNPETPSSKLVDTRYWTERLQNGTASLDMAIEGLGDNPDEVRIGKAIDQIRASPQYQKFLMEQVFTTVGRGDIIAEAVQAGQLAATGVMPGGTGPAGLGTGQIPDMGALATSPNGARAAGTPGSVPGQPGNETPPMQSAAPMANLGG